MLPKQRELVSILCAVALGGLIGLVASLNAADVRWAIVLALAYLVVGIAYTYGYLHIPFLFRIFIAGYLIRVTLAFILYSTHPPIGHVAPDDEFYFLTAINILNLWKQGNYLDLGLYQQAVGSYNWLYSVYVAVHFLAAKSHLLPMVSNAFFGALTCGFIYLLGRNLFGDRVGRLSGVLAVIFPHLVYYSALDLKDTLLVFLLVMGSYYWHRFLVSESRRAFTAFTVSFLSCALLTILRFYVGVLVLFLFIVLYLTLGRGGLVKRVAWLGAFGTLILGVAAITPSL